MITLKEFFDEWTTDELAELYIYRIQADIGKDAIKELIMERLEIEDDSGFELWIRLQ